MNERIKLLAEQAFRETALYGGKQGDKDFDQRYNEMFAELIVRECMEVANIASSDLIKEHFGVEE
jgi:hypothetical protein